ncbi:hypothetical protein BGZ63DRAFT_357899 [Mariannaea sp. PMI_226]|nr:hypothetical protein BGZ63DRAFT_357899 [Mariannaea sp. PMI_226]
MSAPHLLEYEFSVRKEKLHPPSYEWILSDRLFQQWHEDENSRLLWIRGDPGKGKTMLLCGIIETFRKEYKNGNCHGREPIYFFCRESDNRYNTAKSVLRGLLAFLFSKHRDLCDKYDCADKSYPLDIENWDMLLVTFKEVLQDPDLPRIYLIVDALDECVDGLQALIKVIVDLSNVSSTRIKILVSSRNWPTIQAELTPSKQKVDLGLELNASQVSDAVDRYICHRVEELATKKGYSRDLRSSVEQHLKSNANNTFLWVALVCEALAGMDVLSFNTLRLLEDKFPVGLDELYGRMMKDIHRSRDADLYKKILATICVIYRPITWIELTTLLGQPELQHTNDIDIIGSCGSFLSIQHEGKVISFVHQSAKDFLLEDQGEASRQILPDGIAHQHYCVFSTSLQILSTTLRRDMYDLKKPGYLAENILPPTPDPLASVKYSCIYWTHHLLELAHDEMEPRFIECTKNEGILYRFLKDNYLYWLEALSLIVSMPEGVKGMESLHCLLDSIRSPELRYLMNDARRFILSQKGAIEIAPLQAYASALIFSPTNSLIRQLFVREEATVIDLKPGIGPNWDSCLQTLDHRGKEVSVAFLPDGKQLASASQEGTIRIWDATSGSCIMTFEGLGNGLHDKIFSSDGKQLAACRYGTTKIWNVTSGSCIQTLYYIDGAISMLFSSDGNRLALACRDGTIQMWDATSGHYIQTLEGYTNEITSILFSPDGKRLASGSRDGTIKIWDATSGSYMQTLEDHIDVITSIVFSSDGKRLASGSRDGTIKIWDATSGSYIQTLEDHIDVITSIVFSSDGKRLASGSRDGTVKIWDATSGSYIQTLEGHIEITSILFSPDGKRLASGSRDGTIKIWDATLCHGVQPVLVGHTLPDESLDPTEYVRLLAENGTIYLVFPSLNFKNYMDRALPRNLRRRSEYGVSADGEWIVKGAENVLWLPPEYRPSIHSTSMFNVTRIVIGCLHGRVILIPVRGYIRSIHWKGGHLYV